MNGMGRGGIVGLPLSKGVNAPGGGGGNFPIKADRGVPPRILCSYPLVRMNFPNVTLFYGSHTTRPFYTGFPGYIVSVKPRNQSFRAITGYP